MSGYLAAIAAAITPEWVDALDSADLARATGDSPGSGLPVELHGGALRIIPGHEFHFGDHAVVWLDDSGAAIVWGGLDYSDETGADGPWIHGDAVLIDPAVLAERIKEEA